MKLYTEEQVLNSMLSMKTYIEKYDESVIDTIVEKHLKSLGGIELPSDKCDVTQEAVRAVAQNLLQTNEVLQFQYEGDWYELAVRKNTRK